MSMLAEPRKRQKISVNPNGNSWSADSSKFGQKLLEKMGWQEGKGLGRTEHGDTGHVKVKMNMDNRGLGCSKKEADNWIAHQDDFSSLLAQLNEEHSSNSSGANQPQSTNEFKQTQSLSVKSKSSRKRVHYEKFTKGKDVSRYGGKSMNQIFGRRSASDLTACEKSEPSLDCSGSYGLEHSIEEGSNQLLPTESREKDDTHGGNMVASSLNVSDYFAQKMAARKLAMSCSSSCGQNGQPGDADRDCLTSNREEQAEADGRSNGELVSDNSKEDGSADDHDQLPKKKKKKKKRKYDDV